MIASNKGEREPGGTRVETTEVLSKIITIFTKLLTTSIVASRFLDPMFLSGISKSEIIRSELGSELMRSSSKSTGFIEKNATSEPDISALTTSRIIIPIAGTMKPA